MDIFVKQVASDNAVLQLRHRVLREPIGLDLFAEDLSHEKKDLIFAAYVNTLLVGCVLLKPVSNTIAKLRQMAVLPAYQRRGIGEKLVQYFEQYARDNNYKTIALHARETAVPFYQKLGYVQSGAPFEEVGIRHYKMEKVIQ